MLVERATVIVTQITVAMVMVAANCMLLGFGSVSVWSGISAQLDLTLHEKHFLHRVRVI